MRRKNDRTDIRYCYKAAKRTFRREWEGWEMAAGHPGFGDPRNVLLDREMLKSADAFWGWHARLEMCTGRILPLDMYLWHFDYRFTRYCWLTKCWDNREYRRRVALAQSDGIPF